MRFSPPHGWPTVWWELLIVTLGVLIALVAQQAVEAWQWRQVVAEESEALDAEVRELWSAMTSRVAVQPCVDRRLADLGAMFARRDAGQAPALTKPVGRPRTFTATQGAMQIAIADGAVSHMPLAQKQRYFAVYSSYDTFLPLAQEERASWRTLQGLNRAATLSDADWRELRRAYDAATDSNITMKFNLASGREGQWLTPFTAFSRQPINRQVLRLPSVRELCARWAAR